MRLREFAPSPERDDDGDGNDLLLQLANRWWNAADPAKQDRIAATLKSLGYAISQVESEDDAVQITHLPTGHVFFISADDFDPDLHETIQTVRANRDGLDLEARSDDKGISIYAYDAAGRELAFAHFDRTGQNIESFDTSVHDRFRGQGIAAVMYDWAKELGYRVKRSAEQTPAGQYFWSKNRGRKQVWEARMPNEVEDFLYNLTPGDAGVDEVGPYRIHYEGFTDDCQSAGDYCENPDAVYDQVFADHIRREGGRKPVEQNFTGDEDYPILYSVFQIPRQVKEIARIPQGDFGDKDTLTPMANPPKTQPLPGGSHFSYAVNKKDPEFMEIMIFDGDALVAELDLGATLDPLKTWRVETVATDPDYRGQGLGKALYGIALTILKLTLETGATQTKHGQAMWLMLNSIPGVEVMGYAMAPTAEYRARPGDQVVDQNDRWTRYTFPVEPGRRSMRSTRRGTGIYSSQYVSMIARWTGQ